ncbi:MAG: glycosyltransferase family 1 protein [Caulobacteraceae bacterium]|nr:glycosyltransferase family 1 protein [Caulobacter sp.]
MTARFLFTTFEFGGHVAPMLAVAARLQARGHRVLVMSDAATGPDAERLGLPCRPWRRAPNRPDRAIAHEPLRDWECDTPAAVVQLLLDRLMTGAADAYAQDTAEALAEHPGASVVSQELLLGCMLAAEAARRPLALLTANLWPLPTLEGVPPFGPGLAPPADAQARAFQALIREASRSLYDAGLPQLNAARAARGLPPLARTLDQVEAARLVLLATARAWDFPADAALPAAFAYAGPQVRAPAWAAGRPSPWVAAGDMRPLVLASFSTLYQAQEPVIARTLDALAQLPVRGLVTLGPQLDPAAFSAAGNVEVVESADHDALMPQVAAMVTHAGHGSAVRPILHGVPLVCLPMGRDQPDNAARIVARGAGLRLDPAASAAAIAEAVTQVLAQPRFRAAARAWGERMRAETAREGDVAVARLEALAAGAGVPGGAETG